jgi:protein-disulfide isomerase
MHSEQEPLESKETQESQQPARGHSRPGWVVFAIAGGALVACAALVVAVVASIFIPRMRATGTAPTPFAQQAPVTAEPATALVPTLGAQQPPNSMGSPSARVKIIEYADFQCPYCMQFHQDTEPKIINEYVRTGKVYFEYHSVGAFLGEESGAAAQGAYCAGDQGKFWEYHDALFSHWTGENVGDFTNDKLEQYAASLGLDAASFQDCLSSGKYAAILDQDVKDARAAGIRATPSFMINGKLLEGALPFADFQQAIEAALQGQ